MIKLLLTFLLSVGLLTLAACSKKLDDASAVELTQSFVDAQGGRAVTTAAADLTNRLDSELPEALQMPGMRRLISRGWIEERKSVVSYPNFSGKFSGVTHVDYAGNFEYTFQFQSDAMSKPPRVQGSFTQCLGGFANGGRVCYEGSLEGTIERHGPTRITLTQQANGRNDVKLLVVSLLRGQPDTIQGSLELLGQNPISLVGRTTGPDIQVETFTYVRGASFPKDLLDGGNFKLGHLEIDSCTGLLLSSETVAKATCATHINLTSAAEVLFEGTDTKRPSEVTFGKQPDGGWVATGIMYTPPPYSISR